MSQKIDLTSLYEAQQKLDLRIAKNHNITYEKTRTDRLIALLVEICEWANETRCFKYWSYKSSSPKEITIEEYVDALHFFLSLGIDIKTSFVIYLLSSNEAKTLSEDFLELFVLYGDFLKAQDDKTYQKSFGKFIDMSLKCGFSWTEVIEAYKRKLDINFKRQENNY